MDTVLGLLRADMQMKEPKFRKVKDVHYSKAYLLESFCLLSQMPRFKDLRPH